MRTQTARAWCVLFALGLGLVLALGAFDETTPSAPLVGIEDSLPTAPPVEAPVLRGVGDPAVRLPASPRATATLHVTFESHDTREDEVIALVMRLMRSTDSARTVSLARRGDAWEATTRDPSIVTVRETGTRGVYVELRALAPGRSWLVGHARTSRGERLEVAPQLVDLRAGARAEVTLRLDEAVYLARLVVSAHRDARPLARAHVDVHAGNTRVARARTGEDGRTAALVVPADVALSVRVRPPGGDTWTGASTNMSVQVAAHEIRELDLSLPAGPRVRIEAQDPTGTSVSTALSLWRMESSGSLRPVPIMSLLTTDEGRAWTGSLPVGTYRYLLSPHRGFAPSRGVFDIVDPDALTGDVPRDEAGRRHIALPVEPAAPNVRLVLGDIAGPVAQTLVNLNRQAPGTPEAAFASSTTNAQGVLEAPPLEAGRYWALVWERGVARELTVVDGVGIEETWTLPAPTPGGRLAIRGRVEGPQGTALGHLIVLLRKEGTPWWRLRRTERGGSFAFPGLEPGAYEVRLPGAFLGRAPHHPVKASVLLNRADTNVNLRFRPRR